MAAILPNSFNHAAFHGLSSDGTPVIKGPDLFSLL